MAKYSGTPQHANIYLTPCLYHQARKLPPNPKVEQKKAVPKKIYQPHLTDEECLAVIRACKGGLTRKQAVEKFGCTLATVNNLMSGNNRGHLLRMVEEGYESHRMAFRERPAR